MLISRSLHNWKCFEHIHCLAHTLVVVSVKGCSFVCSWMVEVSLSWWNGSFVKETLEGRIWRLYIHCIHILDHQVSLFPSLNAFLVLWLISLFWTHVLLLFYQWDQKLVRKFSQLFLNILIKQPKSVLSVVLFFVCVPFDPVRSSKVQPYIVFVSCILFQIHFMF